MVCKFVAVCKKEGEEVSGRESNKNPLFWRSWLQARKELKSSDEIKAAGIRTLPYLLVEIHAAIQPAKLTGDWSEFDAEYACSKWAMAFGVYMLPIILNESKTESKIKFQLKEPSIRSIRG